MQRIYSDIEVTAKVCMDPESMFNVMMDLKYVTEHASKNYPNLAALIDEMHSILSRLASMNCLPPSMERAVSSNCNWYGTEDDDE